MLVLKSQSIGFRISTTYLSLTYTESDGVNIKVDALELISTEKDYVQIELVFTTVAEVKCATVNFHEVNYNNIVIKKVDGENLDSGIYQVMNSVPLEEKERLYDPKKRLKLKHYIIAGYDSYVEILATGFSCIRCQAIDGVK
ncbi:hypothetical protein RL877_000829 [Escherichia coli]|nr:hypothetical protein [Escherichia coli]